MARLAQDIVNEAYNSAKAFPVLDFLQAQPAHIVRPKLVLKDGTTISVQASKHHYSLPQKDEGPWTHFEVLCNSIVDTSITELSNVGVQAYVSLFDIMLFIESRGGVDPAATYKLRHNIDE